MKPLALLASLPPQEQILIGVDEVGRGPLIGNVVAAAVIWPAQMHLPGLTDSKKLSSKRRAQLVPQIQQHALAYAIGEATPAEIDQLNILQATFLAMRRALGQLPQSQAFPIYVDGNQCPGIHCIPVVKGDSLVPAIAAASILAKEHRDAQLLELDQIFPQYGFAQHKGYPTAAHLQAIAQYGVLPQHRRSYKPVAQALGIMP